MVSGGRRRKFITARGARLYLPTRRSTQEAGERKLPSGADNDSCRRQRLYRQSEQEKEGKEKALTHIRPRGVNNTLRCVVGPLFVFRRHVRRRD